MRKLALAVLALIALAVGLILFTGELDEEEAVRRAIEQVAEGAEAGDVGDTLEPIAPEWEHSGRNLDRQTLHAMLVRQFLQGKRMHAALGPIDVALGDDDTAHASFEVWLAEGGDGLGVWPERSDALHIEVDLEKRDGDWLIVASEHEAILK